MQFRALCSKQPKEGIRKLAVLPFVVASILLLTQGGALADGASPVEGESLTYSSSNGSITTDAVYSGGQALKLIQNGVVAQKSVTFSERSDIVVKARTGAPSGAPELAVVVDGVESSSQVIAKSDVPQSYTYDVNVSAGTHTIALKTSNVTSSRYVAVDVLNFPADPLPDTTPPETTIDSGPSGFVNGGGDYTNGANELVIEFTFSSSEPGSTFECSLDGAPFSACTSPKTYNLGPSYVAGIQGEHTFQVRAIDAVGNVDLTPASRTFIVDTIAPRVIIEDGSEVYDTTYPGSVSVPFEHSEPAQTVCKLWYADEDGPGEYNDTMVVLSEAPCISPITFTNLDVGRYALELYTTDTAGNQSYWLLKQFWVTP